METIGEALESSALARREATMLKWMYASRGRRLAHVRGDGDSRLRTAKARVAVMKTRSRLMLAWDRAPVSAVGNERNRVHELRWMVADRMTLKSRGALAHAALVVG